MSLYELRMLVPSPEMPVGKGTRGQWDAVEEVLRTRLPQDYKQLVDCYGIGWFANWICVFSPFSDEFNLITMQQSILDRHRQGQRTSPEYAPPYPAFPEPGGLLPWGQDDNAGVFCWLTSGNPDDWPVVYLDNKYSEQYHLLQTSVTGLLAGCFNGSITGDWYPEDVFPTQERIFTPGNAPQY